MSLTLGILLATLVAIALGAVLLRMAYRRRQRNALRPNTQQPNALTSIEQLAAGPPANEPPSTPSFYLCCPHCGFEGPLDDLELVSESVDCPICEQPFVVLEPEPASVCTK